MKTSNRILVLVVLWAIAATAGLGILLVTRETDRAPAPELFTLSMGGEYVPVSYEPGLPLEDLEFLDPFWGPLLPSVPDDSQAVKEALRTHLGAEYTDLRPVIAARWPELSDAELFLVYVMLRVAGSTPVYEPVVPTESLKDALISPNGDCGTHTLRTLLILEAFGIPAKGIPIWTPSMQGHVVATSYQAEHMIAALIDPTTRVIYFMRGADQPFFEMVVPLSPAERAQHLNAETNVRIVAPFFYPYFDLGTLLPGSNFGYNLTEFHRLNSVNRELGWPLALSEELDFAIRLWDWNNSEGLFFVFSNTYFGNPFNLSSYANGALGYDPEYQLPVESLMTLSVQQE